MAAGLNRTTWNLDYPGPTTFPGMGVGRHDQRSGRAARTVSGSLDRRRKEPDAAAHRQRHPLRSATDADLKEQFDLATQIRDKASEANNA
jgi:hypothetical protein